MNTREDRRRRKESQQILNRMIRQHRQSQPKGKSPAFLNKQLDRILEERYGAIRLVKEKGFNKKSNSFFKLYRIENTIYKRIETFVRSCFPKILPILSINHKVIYSLKFVLAKEEQDEHGNSYIKKREHVENHHPIELVVQDDLQASLDRLPNYFTQFVAELEANESGWQLFSIDYLDTKLVEYTPFRGGCYGKLPLSLQHKQCIVTMQNTDNECLKWAVTVLFFNIEGKNRGRITKSLQEQAKLFNWRNVSFPAGVKDLETFSKNNPNVALFVYGKQKKEYFILFNGFRKSDASHQDANRKKIFLFYYNSHYFPIVNIDAFHRWIFNSKDKIHVCFDCLSSFTSSSLLEHTVYCRKNTCSIRTKMPPKRVHGKKNTIHFKNHKNTQFYPYSVYLDTESSISQKEGKHEPYIFGTLFIDHITQTQEYNTWKTANEFISYLVQLAKSLPHHPEIPTVCEKATCCYYCKETFTPHDTLVRDHCHFSGKFRGMAHQKCNLLLQQKRMLPVFAHNMSRYDEKTFIRALKEKENFNVDIIAKNIEHFISFGFTVYHDDLKTHVKFLDSLKFLNGSLDTLSQNLLHQGKDAFVYTHRVFATTFHDILLKKGVFPYEYITNESILDTTTTLPPHYQFYSSLKDESISNEDYHRAQQVWELFQCKNLRDYMNIYLKLDVCLLADVFEHFRTCIYNEYRLDPVYYITLSSLAIDCALKYTQQTLERIHCPTMYNFIEQSIRGGISMITKRYAKANNETCPDYDPKQKKSYILYLDANNLYGWAMMQNLPVGNFRWLDPTHRQTIDCIPDNAFVDVDLHCPEKLFEKFSDYPLCPTHEKRGTSKKLLTTFSKKEHYICHARYLKFVLQQGYILDKVHKILAFNEKPWLKPYIEKNTLLRSKARSTFEKDLWKIMNNAVFGKQIENVRKRVNIRLEMEDSARKLVQKPNFKNIIELENTDTIFTRNEQTKCYP